MFSGGEGDPPAKEDPLQGIGGEKAFVNFKKAVVLPANFESEKRTTRCRYGKGEKETPWGAEIYPSTAEQKGSPLLVI